MERRLIRNVIQCKHCGDVIESTYTHDFKWCSCGKVFVDGGHEYGRRGYTDSPESDYIEMAIWEDNNDNE